MDEHLGMSIWHPPEEGGLLEYLLKPQMASLLPSTLVVQARSWLRLERAGRQ